MYGIPADIDWSVMIGAEVIQICIGTYNVIIHFFNDISISMGDCFEYISDGKELASDPVLSRKATTLVALLGAVVRQVSVEDGKVLIVTFSNGEVLKVSDVEERYESFSVCWKGMSLYV